VGDGSIGVIEALIGLGFAASRGEAKRLIAGGGARLDGEPVRDDTTVITVAERRLSSARRSTASSSPPERRTPHHPIEPARARHPARARNQI
jgi:tyrosyl-tRNA synthetase